MAPNPQKLTCVSLLICDDIYRDGPSKKLAIIGVFNSFEAHKFPFFFQRVGFLVSLTNGRGDYTLSLAIQHDKSGVEALRVKAPFHLKSPLEVHDFDIRIENLRLLEPGKYWLVIESEGEVLAQRPFTATLVPDPEPEQGKN